MKRLSSDNKSYTHFLTFRNKFLVFILNTLRPYTSQIITASFNDFSLSALTGINSCAT